MAALLRAVLIVVVRGLGRAVLLPVRLLVVLVPRALGAVVGSLGVVVASRVAGRPFVLAVIPEQLLVAGFYGLPVVVLVAVAAGGVAPRTSVLLLGIGIRAGIGVCKTNTTLSAVRMLLRGCVCIALTKTPKTQPNPLRNLQRTASKVNKVSENSKIKWLLIKAQLKKGTMKNDRWPKKFQTTCCDLRV